MDVFATVIVILAMIVLGALAVQLFTASHDDRMAPPPPGRSPQTRPWHRTRKP